MSLIPCLQRVERDLANNLYSVEAQQEMTGVFTVTESKLLEEKGGVVQQQELLVSFGDSNTGPGCTCASWCRSKLPCVHMFIIFQTIPQWKYDALCPVYRFNKCLSIDFSCFDSSSIEEAIKQEFKADIGLQVEPLLYRTNVATQKSSGSLFRKSENLPSSQVLIKELKEYHYKTLSMEKIFDDRELFASLCKDLRTLISRLDKRVNSNGDTTQMKDDFVSLTSLFNSNKNSAMLKKRIVPDPGLNLGICKTPIITEVVSIEKQSSQNNPTDDTAYKSKPRVVKVKSSTLISTTTDSLTCTVPTTPDKKNAKNTHENSLEKNNAIKSPNDTQTTGRKRNASLPPVVSLSMEVAKAVNILTNSSIHSKKVKHDNGTNFELNSDV